MNFNDRYGGTPPVIVVEPVRSGSASSAPPPPRGPEINPDTAGAGKGFGEWVKDEAAWGAVHFLRAIFTVIVYRGLYHLFTKGIASQQAFDQAPDLWTKGKKESGFRRGNGGGAGGYSTAGGGGGMSFGPRPARAPADPPWWSSQRYAAGATSPGNGTRSSETTATEADRLILGRDGPYTIYDNSTVLDRSTQFWACNLLYKTPCEQCRFMEPDPSGVNHCAAVIKAQMLRDGSDLGVDLEEIREMIRRGL